MTEEPTRLRQRTMVARGMKGQYSFEAVVDSESYTADEHVQMQKDLVDKMEALYPLQLDSVPKVA